MQQNVLFRVSKGVVLWPKIVYQTISTIVLLVYYDDNL